MTEAKETTTECKGTNLLQEGRRHLISREYSQAVEKLSEACELLAEKHGEAHVDLADAFYSYGEALLEMARMETPVLGNALKGVPDVIAEQDDKDVTTEEPDESLNDEMKEEIADKVIDALCEAPVVDNKSTEKNSEENKKDEAEAKSETDAKEAVESEKTEKTEEEKQDEKGEGEGEAENKKEDEKEGEEEDGETPMEEGNEEEATEEGDEEDGEDADEATEADDATAGNDDEVGNLQLAWETIEVARTLYEKRAAAEDEACQRSKLRIADCHRKLGEVLLERDEWTAAAEELQKCLKIEKNNLELPSRRVAETYFEIGVAFDNANKLNESADAFQESAESIEACQKKLKDKADKSSEDEAEIEELDGILKEIKTRKAEVMQRHELQPQPLGDAGAGSSNGVTTNGFGSESSAFNGASTTNGFGHSSENGNSTKETQDISHLIRKRPKESSDTSPSPVKKSRVEAAGDGSEASTETSK